MNKLLLVGSWRLLSHLSYNLFSLSLIGDEFKVNITSKQKIINCPALSKNYLRKLSKLTQQEKLYPTHCAVARETARMARSNLAKGKFNFICSTTVALSSGAFRGGFRLTLCRTVQQWCKCRLGPW